MTFLMSKSINSRTDVLASRIVLEAYSRLSSYQTQALILVRSTPEKLFSVTVTRIKNKGKIIVVRPRLIISLNKKVLDNFIC